MNIDNPFDKIDVLGSINKNEPFVRDIEAEMVRSHALCLQISAKKPTDPDYQYRQVNQDDRMNK